MTRQTTDQLYIDLEYFSPEEYFVYTAEAESQQTSDSTLSCDASVIAGGEVVMSYGDWESFATIEITLSHIYGADLFAFTNASLEIQVDRIRDTNTQTSSQFDLATDYVKTVSADSFETAIVTVAITAKRSLVASMNAQVAFLLSATANAVPVIAANLQASFYQAPTSLTRTTRTAKQITLLTTNPAGAISDSIKKFGSGSLFQRARLETPHGIQLRNNNFTIDLWFYAGDRIGGDVKTVILCENSTAGDVIKLDWEATERRFKLFTGSSAGNRTNYTEINSAYNQVWHHIRLTSQLVSTTRYFTLWLNGQQVIQYTQGILNDTTGYWYFGQSNSYIDELLVKQGTVLTDYQTTSFAVPSQAWVNDTETSLLVHFDGNTNDDNTAPPRTQVGQATLNSTSALTALVIRNIGPITSAINAQTTLVCLAEEIPEEATSALEVNTELTVIPDKVIVTTSAVDVTSDLTADLIRIRSTTVSTESVSSQMTVVAMIGDFFINCQVQTNLSLTTGNIISASSLINANAQLTSNAVKTAQESSAITAITTAEIQTGKIQPFTSNLVSAFSIQANISEIDDFIVQLTSQTSMFVEVRNTKQTSAQLTNLSQLTAQVDKVISTNINIAATTELIAVSGVTVGTSADLQAFAAKLVLITVIHIDPDLTYRIPAENRTYRITRELRDYTVIAERRTYTI